MIMYLTRRSRPTMNSHFTTEMKEEVVLSNYPRITTETVPTIPNKKRVPTVNWNSAISVRWGLGERPGRDRSNLLAKIRYLRKRERLRRDRSTVLARFIIHEKESASDVCKWSNFLTKIRYSRSGERLRRNRSKLLAKIRYSPKSTAS